jgi:DNA/RNA endonuclease YhcR with UshA esterase domain
MLWCCAMVVEGRIELYRGKPEIKLEDAGQLRW